MPAVSVPLPVVISILENNPQLKGHQRVIPTKKKHHFLVGSINY